MNFFDISQYDLDKSVTVRWATLSIDFPASAGGRGTVRLHETHSLAYQLQK